MTQRLVLLVLLAAGLPAQELLLSTTADLGSGPSLLRKEDVVALAAGAASARMKLPREAWTVLFRDRNGNGLLDDLVPVLDAVDVGSPEDLTTWVFSVASNTTMPGGLLVRDGDLFRFDAQGQIVILWTEDALAAATGTSTIDVDALAVAPSGTIYFSFADDETTTLPGLIAQNGGNALLDEQTVFRLDPGQSTAVIHLTQAQVAATFSQALGIAVTTVVDVVGLEMDRDGGPTDLLLTSASTSAAIRGRVVSTAQGGRVATIGGVPVDVAAAGWPAPPSFDLLGWLPNDTAPVLRASPDILPAGASGTLVVTVERLVPGQAVQFAASMPLAGTAPAFTVPGTQGFPFVALDVLDPIFWITAGTPHWRVVADALGTASLSFAVGGLPPGRSGVIQAITVDLSRLSNPAGVTFLP
jgi:hypothetical protein